MPAVALGEARDAPKQHPLIMVLVEGRQRLLGNAVAAADAILHAYLPGELQFLCFVCRQLTAWNPFHESSMVVEQDAG